MSPQRLRAVLLSGLIFLLGCTQEAPVPAPAPAPTDNPSPRCEQPARSPRVVRLTHAQYANTLRALTGLELVSAMDMPADPNEAGFDRGSSLRVGDVLGRSYQEAAERVAAAVVASPSAFQKVVGCAPSGGEACAREYLTRFGRRLFRRPLTAAEHTRYQALFQGSRDLYADGDAFQRGVRATLEALLQSPVFLYRTELGTSAPSAGFVPLDDFEVASRLSFTLLDTTPDDTLLQAAEERRLHTPEQVAEQAKRLLALPEARQVVRAFHRQWLDLNAYENRLAKDSTLYPGVTPDLAPVLREETERFVEAVTFDAQRGLGSLYTAPFTFVNQRTAPLYGLTGRYGDALTRVELDPSRRAGLLTQVGFLASHATFAQSSPILRGAFIQRRLLCNPLPDPPPNVPAAPPLDGTQVRTTREQVAHHTAAPACAGCHHNLINPVGYGLEHYDAVGRYRTHENGHPVDASGMLVGTQAQAPFNDATGLSRAMAASPEARQCYARQWLRFSVGRMDQEQDACALEALAERLEDDRYTAVSLLVDLVQSRGFLSRGAEDAP